MKLHVLYIFSGTRTDRFIGVLSVDYPDTQLHGLNHLREFSIDAEYKEFGDFIKPAWVGRLLGFRLCHFLMFFMTASYDVVFGPSLYYLMPWRLIFGHKGTKFVLLNTSLNRMIQVNSRSRIKKTVSEMLVRKLDAIVCLSHAQEKQLHALCTKLPPTYYIPLGVDDTYHSMARGRRDDFILSGGRDNGRDYQTVIDVAARMPTRRFVIFCSRRNIANISSIPSNVEIRYDIGLDEARKLYRTAQLLILATYPDGHPDGADCSGQTVLLDAMASGLPVIATHKLYLEDYVTDGQDALVAEPQNPQSIISCIERLSDKTVREKLAHNSRKRMEKDFTSKKMAERLATIFKSLQSL